MEIQPVETPHEEETSRKPWISVGISWNNFWNPENFIAFFYHKIINLEYVCCLEFCFVLFFMVLFIVLSVTRIRHKFDKSIFDLFV
jgi:hypothetical protein